MRVIFHCSERVTRKVLTGLDCKKYNSHASDIDIKQNAGLLAGRLGKGFWRRMKFSVGIRRVQVLSMWLALGLGSMTFTGDALRCSAQVTTSTLTGTVTDADGAIIPSAQVTIVNENNKFTRTVEANSSGVFTFASIASGDYDLKITYKGFSALQITKVHLDPGDTRTLANLKLKIGEVTQVINVEADNLNHVEDTGERSSIITSKDLQKLTLEGRDVTELLKILPGSAIGPGGNNGTNNGNGPGNVAFDSSNVQIGGAAGSYAMSGSPTNGVSITSDGANLTDPGTYSGGLQTVNGENTAEVKVQQGNFGADTANGPLVINAVGKSGGSSYHGELYAFARTYQLNATDSFSKEVDAPKPPDRYVYPGGQIGGPVKIPGTDFNHNKKLTFFVSGEDYAQRNTYAYGSVSSAQWGSEPDAALQLPSPGDFNLSSRADLPGELELCPRPVMCQ